MVYIKKDVNHLLLFLVLLSCTALIGLTVVFAYQFEAVNIDKESYNTEIQSKLTELNEKAQKVTELEKSLAEQKQREQELQNLLAKKRR